MERCNMFACHAKTSPAYRCLTCDWSARTTLTMAATTGSSDQLMVPISGPPLD